MFAIVISGFLENKKKKNDVSNINYETLSNTKKKL